MCTLNVSHTLGQIFQMRLSSLSPKMAILNDVKNLLDVHNPQTIPDLGVKFSPFGLGAKKNV